MLSLIAIIYGAIVALVQPDLKRLVAYSSVSHMGFVTLGIFVFTEQGLQGAILQMINHGLITGALFLLVGVIYERTHDRTIAKMGGLAARTPVYAAIFGFFVFASAGLPGLSGFVGEFLVLVGTFAVNPCAAAVATLRDDPGRRLPALHVPARSSSASCPTSWPGLGDHLTDMTPGRDPDPRAARRARRRLRAPARAPARPGRRAPSRATLDAVRRGAPRSRSRPLVVVGRARPVVVVGIVVAWSRWAATRPGADAGRPAATGREAAPALSLAGPRDASGRSSRRS